MMITPIRATELNTLTAPMENINLSVAAMLDTLSLGIFSFDANGLCSSFYSKACLTLLEKAPGGKSVVDVLGLSDGAKETTAALLDFLFSDTSNVAFVDDFLDLLPRTLSHSKGLSISLAYSPICDPLGKIQAILVTATDRTNEIAALNLSREREAAALRVLRMSSNRNLFTRFFQSASIYFSVAIGTLSDHVPLESVRRDIHTLKGNASIFYLHALVDILHDMESALSGVASIQEVRDILKNRLPAARKALLEVKKEAVKIFGDNFDRQGSMRTIPLDLLRSFAVELKLTETNAALAERFVSLLMGESIRKPLAAFDIELQELADRYGRTVNSCIFTGDNFPILTENYDPLFSALTHLSRNIIAHAIDSAEAREKWQKPPYLTVTIDTHFFEREGKQWMSLSLTDDGRGIDTVCLRRKLKMTKEAAAADTASEDEIMQSIFQDNVSTSDEVSELSGRGVGMSAVKNAIEHLNGTIRVESELHRFTRVIIEVPMLWT